MKTNRLMVMCLMMSSGNAFSAAGTGAFDGAIFAELQVHTAKLLDNIERLTESLDISKRMEEMESLKSVKRISAEGLALKKVVNDIENIDEIVEDKSHNLLNQKDLLNQIDSLQYQIDNADNPRAYANLASDLKRVRFLGQANKAAMKQLIQGSNEADDNKSAATASLIMSDILIKREEREAITKAEEMQALQAIIGNNGYSELYGEDE